MQSLDFNESDKWSFVGEGWQTRGDDGQELTALPPWNVGLEAYDGQECANDDVHLALRTDRAYGDFDARFKFRWDSGNCGVGLMFRARDARHYYLAHFPCIGQCARASHFWALISKVDGNGWAEVLQMEIVPGVASEGGIWHDARVVANGHEFQLAVDGRRLPPVRDDTFAEPGMVGFEVWHYAGASASLRDFAVLGEPSGLGAFDPSVQPVKNWRLPYAVDRHLAVDPEQLAIPGHARQACTGVTRAPDGKLLMALTVRQRGALVASTDNGRSWEPFDSPSFPGGWVHTLRNGRSITLIRPTNFDLLFAESADNGKTWSQPQPIKQEPFVPPQNAPTMRLGCPRGYLELHDGTLLGFQIGGIPDWGNGQTFDIWEWGAYPLCCAYSTRSTDGGLTWSAPVPMNGPPAKGQKYDMCECYSNMQTKEGRVVSLIRPIYSAWMWEIWSEDEGRSWGPATVGPFPCYSNCSLVTENGTLLVSGRMPALGLYASFDSGLNWKTYRADTAALWATGQMYEVEPNLVFYVYMDHYDSSMRAQFLRINADSIEPATE